MKYLVTTLFATALMSGGSFPSLAMAEDGDQKKACEYYKGGHHGGAEWKASLTDEQRKKVDALREDFYKQKHEIRAKIKAAKVELAKETIKDTPDQSVIYVKINDVVKLKATKMRLKAAYHINIRKLLTKEQRVKFDEHVVKRASQGRRYKGRYQ